MPLADQRQKHLPSLHEFRGGVQARDDRLLLEIAYHDATADTP